mgnify:CR=1 FL=1
MLDEIRLDLGLIDLGIEVVLISGDPDFGTPSHIIEAAAEMSYAGRTGYAPAIGLPDQYQSLDTTATADRIILNPAAFDQMGSLGRQIVLSHEVTHVATRASAVVSAPLWLEEGFADYLAYRNTGLSRREIAKDLIRDVRARKGPTALPDSDSFDAMRHTDVAPAYVASWFAVQTIADRSDPDEVVRFYRIATGMDRDGAAVTPDQALAEAFAEVLGTDEATFESQWLAAVRRLAGRAG